MPLVCAGVLLLSVRLAGVRLRWWSPIAAVAGGLLCAALAAQFGTWAIFAVALVVFLGALPVAPARRRG